MAGRRAAGGCPHLPEARRQLRADPPRKLKRIDSVGVDHGTQQACTDRDQIAHLLALEHPFKRRRRGARVGQREGEDRDLLADSEGPQPRLEILGGRDAL